MKNKIIFITLLIITLLGTTIAFATDNLNAKPNANVRDLVGDETTNEVNDNLQAAPISSLDATEPMVSGDNFEKMEQNKSTRGDLYILEDNASVENDVDGNLFVLADNVDISANVNGNVFVMGTNVNLKSNVSGSVFALADNLNFVNGQATDVYFFGTNISLAESAVVSREAKMMGDSIKISGTITGDLYTQADKVSLDENGSITGKLVYSGELNKVSEDQIGSLEKQEIEKTVVETKSTFESKAESVLSKTVTALFIIGLIVLVADKKMESKITISDSIKGIVGGFAWIIIIPVIVLLLMITIIGLPFSIILLGLYVLMFFVAIPAMSLQISTYILNIKNKDSKLLLWLLGVVIYCALAILRQIPTVGGVITFISGLYGFNLIIKTLFSKKKKENKIENQVVTE